MSELPFQRILSSTTMSGPSPCVFYFRYLEICSKTDSLQKKVLPLYSKGRIIFAKLYSLSPKISNFAEILKGRIRKGACHWMNAWYVKTTKTAVISLSKINEATQMTGSIERGCRMTIRGATFIYESNLPMSQIMTNAIGTKKKRSWMYLASQYANLFCP